MLTADLIVAEARTWLGVPVQHQGMTRAGVDCGGLVLAVGLAAGALSEKMRDDPRLKKFAAYGREPVGSFLEACDIFFDRVDEPIVGGVVAMRFKDQPRHAAIVGDYQYGGVSIIHALRHNVREHRLDPRWAKYVVACYKFRGVSYER
jgi:hypothetical protein